MQCSMKCSVMFVWLGCAVQFTYRAVSREWRIRTRPVNQEALCVLQSVPLSVTLAEVIRVEFHHNARHRGPHCSSAVLAPRLGTFHCSVQDSHVRPIYLPALPAPSLLAAACRHACDAISLHDFITEPFFLFKWLMEGCSVLS